ncbi:MAG: hypothetical protein M1433_00810 [Candidatus Parvarchaeota archaeon]|nr:hypothetical protein [Candidatus Parvarchaeota archaeon]
MENRYIMFTFAILASLMVIAIVMLLSQYMSYNNLSQVSQSLQQAEENLQTLQVLSLLGNSNSTSNCGILTAGLGTLSTQLSQIGSEVQAADMENQSGAQYVNLVNQLSYARIEYWLLSQRINSQCGGKLTTVLIFYKPQNCEYCVLETSELSYLQGIDSNLTFVGLDGEWNLPVVQAVVSSYNLSSSDYPAIVINGKYVVKGYLTSNQLLSVLCSHMNSTAFCNGSI